jgi:hypothetical protein
MQSTNTGDIFSRNYWNFLTRPMRATFFRPFNSSLSIRSSSWKRNRLGHRLHGPMSDLEVLVLTLQIIDRIRRFQDRRENVC